jgi:hypothetical protein
MSTKVLILALAVALAGALYAQTSTATVDGLVQDTSASAVPNEKATVRNADFCKLYSKVTLSAWADEGLDRSFLPKLGAAN